MVRENRIKEYVFPVWTVNGSVISPMHTSQVINGEILKYNYRNIASPGSLWLVESGTNIEIFRKNDLTSGMSAGDIYPFTYMFDQTNAAGSPQTFTHLVTNNNLYIAGSGFTSGTGKTCGPITIYYR